MAFLFFSCGEDEASFEPLESQPETDALSVAARGLVTRNSAILDGVSVEAANADFLPLLEDAKSEANGDCAFWLREVEARSEEKYIHPIWLQTAVAIQKAEIRDRIYLFYGDLSDLEIDQEAGAFVPHLREMISPLGYELVVETEATFDKWRESLLKRDAAAVIWRGHGNMETSPYGKNRKAVSSRVVATKKQSGSRPLIWADDWAALLPEGLVHIAVASCMSDGVFLPDEWSLIENRRGVSRESADVTTFESLLSHRAVYYRGYRGASFSPNLDGLGETAMAHFLPDRTKSGAEARPPWMLVWAHLYSFFDNWRRERFSDSPLSMDTYCALDWFRCLFEGAGERAPAWNRETASGNWILEIPSDEGESYRCPLNRKLELQVSETGEVTHNLQEILDAYDANTAQCTSI